jgi:hypothetical protein
MTFVKHFKDRVALLDMITQKCLSLESMFNDRKEELEDYYENEV